MLHSPILKSPEAQASDIIRSPGLSHNQKPGSVKAQASTIIRSLEASRLTSSLRFKPAIIVRSLGISHHRTGPTLLIHPEAQACIITRSPGISHNQKPRSPGFETHQKPRLLILNSFTSPEGEEKRREEEGGKEERGGEERRREGSSFEVSWASKVAQAWASNLII